MTVAAVLLAAGESRRMGTPKPLLDWLGKTLVEYQITQLQSVVDSVVAVLGHRSDEVRPLVERSGALLVINENYHEGRASSLRAAASALPDDTSSVVVLNVDQPRPASVIQRLIDEHKRTGNLITVPLADGRRGHPPVISGSLLPELRAVQEETLGLRAIIDRHAGSITEVDFDSSIVLLDLNDPADYETAQTEYMNVAGDLLGPFTR